MFDEIGEFCWFVILGLLIYIMYNVCIKLIVFELYIFINRNIGFLLYNVFIGIKLLFRYYVFKFK